MWCRIFCAALMSCLALHVFAQDPTKVEPKHYKLDFENDRVQVVSVHYGPHEKSEMHDHPGGVVVVVTGGHLRFTNGKVHDTFAKPGEARWFPPVKHKVENLGDEAYNAVYVGIKGKLSGAVADPEEESPVNAEQLAALLAEYSGPIPKP